MLCVICFLVICPRRMSFVPGKCHLTPVPQEGIKHISCSCIFTNQKAPNNQSSQQPKPSANNQQTWLIALFPALTFA
ncbi:hypothetical protein FR483_n379L [Paramecium bursaria Chlorella virus FR483]|uniref:Uncharacterized protein n379L n=1 Tax=Paramecium bursaria Chlorella virus FR483 TaxID=399781 RepID=A7J783_PBCVF|nr:hypothetical protein FR483_n379L [Paramecium bursaria Chlorella virus FR483]ABT15664.1 hypothetical protein FR483_n379L [Paramecium bursaria Chlorella virus FR483]